MRTEAEFIERVHDLMMSSQGADRVFLKLYKDCTPTIVRLQENVREPEQFANLIVGMLMFTGTMWVSNVTHVRPEVRAEMLDKALDELRRIILSHPQIKGRFSSEVSAFSDRRPPGAPH